MRTQYGHISGHVQLRHARIVGVEADDHIILLKAANALHVFSYLQLMLFMYLHTSP
jgi:hypothetical protein